jgi:hypothetical protein
LARLVIGIFKPWVGIESTTHGERILTVGTTTLIASKSQPGGWHTVTTTTCTCPSFAYRSRCRHIVAVQQAEQAAADEAKAARAARIAELNSEIWG